MKSGASATATAGTAQAVTAFGDAAGAAFSPCGAYRWQLHRRWDSLRPALLFIGLNPSRADGIRDDPTLRRLLGFARRWGHGSLTVVNLFARISPSPAALRRCADPIGPANDGWLRRALGETLGAPMPATIWLGWGNGGLWRDRDRQVLELLAAGGAAQRLRALGCTACGQPRHPLYAPGGACLEPLVLAQGQRAAAS